MPKKQKIGKRPLFTPKMMRIPALSEYKLPPRIAICGVEIPLNKPGVREAMEQEFYISLSNRASVILWIKRSGRYFPHIEKRLREKGMPDDLKYLAVAESDLRPTVGSRAGAIGIWQFMPATGRSHGLRADSYVDRRRDFNRSTEAATTFLTNLNKQFNNWLLAMAAYNCGPGCVSKQLRRQGVDSYFDLDLPRETERYIFRIAAIKVIMGNPSKYGVDLEDNERYSPIDSDIVTVTIKSKTVDLATIAKAAGMNTRRFTNLNPAFVSSSLPRGAHSIYVPKGTSGKFIETWNKLYKSGATTGSLKTPPQQKITYTVRRGDTLASIARKNGVSVDDICRWNRINRKDVLRSGKRLTIYR